MPKVLIVDDHAFIRRGVQGILKENPDWQLCGEADNGNDAVRMTGELLPEAIVMDVSMPGMNGVAATREIRRTNPDVKILLLTLHESAELMRSAFQAGVNGYLLKTDAEQELLRALAVIMEQKTYVSPRVDETVAREVQALARKSAELPESDPRVDQRSIVQPNGRSSAEHPRKANERPGG